MHNHGLMLVVGGRSELGVRMRVNVGVSTDHGEIDVVGTTVSGVTVTVVVAVVVVVAMAVVVAVVVVVVVMAVVTVGVDIVVRVSIIGDQGAASIVTGEFDLVWVDVIERSDNSLAINLDHSLVRVDCGSSELWVNVSSSFNISSSDVELNTVGTLRLMVVFVVVVRFRMRFLMVRIVWLLIATAEGVPVRQLSVSAGENRSASVVHLGSESELLAVKDKGILVGIEISLSIIAFILDSMDKALHSLECLIDISCVGVDVVLVGSDSASVVGDFVVELVNVVTEVADGGLEGLESNEQLSLNLNSLFVVILVPNLIVFVELVDLSVEISTWEFLAVLMLIIRLSVVVSDGEARLVIPTVWLSCISSEGSGVGGKSCSSESDSEFHNFILSFLNEYQQEGFYGLIFNEYFR